MKHMCFLVIKKINKFNNYGRSNMQMEKFLYQTNYGV